MLNRKLTRRRMIAIAATAAGSAFLAVAELPRPAMPCGGADRHSARKSRSRSIIRTAPRPNGLSSCVSRTCGGWSSNSACTEASSAISALNRTGILVSPDADMVALLKASLLFADLTDGAFDPTVQPLWQLYADHFSSEKPDPEGPSPHEAGRNAGESGAWRPACERDRVALTRRGAAITLNGIAQGYATDRVVDRLRSAGLSTTLVNMGEIRAIGRRPEGTPWRVGLADPDKPGALTETIDLVDRAVATSAGAGFRFDSEGPVYASVRSGDGTQPVAVQHGERHRANRHRSGCAFDRVQLDAVVADPAHRGRQTERAGPHHRFRRNFDRM